MQFPPHRIIGTIPNIMYMEALCIRSLEVYNVCDKVTSWMMIRIGKPIADMFILTKKDTHRRSIG